MIKVRGPSVFFGPLEQAGENRRRAAWRRVQHLANKIEAVLINWESAVEIAAIGVPELMLWGEPIVAIVVFESGFEIAESVIADTVAKLL